MQKERRKFEIPAGAVYALVAAISLICVTVMAVAIGADWDRDEGEKLEVEEEPILPTPHLKIEDVFFRSLESQNIQVKLTVYITNDGLKEAEDVRVDAWPVVEESNLATDSMNLDFGDIGVNQTERVDESLVLEAGHVHSVELLVFESDMLVLMGRATVSTEGVGGTDYQDTEVRGGSGDSDYDGIPDAWETKYGLDPEDPRDADLDKDGDGFSNLDEYKLNRDPTRGIEEPCESEGADKNLDGFGIEEEGGGAAFLGAFVVLIFMVGIIGVLVFAAVRSHRKKEEKDFNMFQGETDDGTEEDPDGESEEEVPDNPKGDLVEEETKMENNREGVELRED